MLCYPVAVIVCPRREHNATSSTGSLCSTYRNTGCHWNVRVLRSSKCYRRTYSEYSGGDPDKHVHSGSHYQWRTYRGADSRSDDTGSSGVHHTGMRCYQLCSVLRTACRLLRSVLHSGASVFLRYRDRRVGRARTVAGRTTEGVSGTGRYRIGHCDHRTAELHRMIHRTSLLVLTALMLVGCGEDGSTSTAHSVRGTSDRTSAQYVQVAVPRGSSLIRTYVNPTLGSSVRQTFGARTDYGSPRVFVIVNGRRDFVQVRLPARPNGQLAWLPRSKVHIHSVSDRILVRTQAHTITIVVNGETRIARIGVGSQRYPTPHGQFYVTDRVSTRHPKSAYGAFALGLSAYSEVLTEFGGGDGQVGIHGTNDPDSIGRSVSHGCIRVPYDVVPILRMVQLGTPVTIMS